MKNKTETPVHVRVSEPRDLRRSILLGEENCIRILQSGKDAYNKLNMKNMERKTIVAELSEINKLLGTIERNLPKVATQKKPEKKVKAPKAVAKKVKPKVIPKHIEKTLTYSQKLEEELDSIKHKLAAL